MSFDELPEDCIKELDPTHEKECHSNPYSIHHCTSKESHRNSDFKGRNVEHSDAKIYFRPS